MTQTTAIPARSTLSDAVDALSSARRDWRGRHPASTARFPARGAVERVVELLAAALYHRRLGGFRAAVTEEDHFVAAKLIAALGELEREIENELAYWQHESQARFDADQAATITRLFAAGLGEVRRLVDSDVEAAFLGDPAARSVDEILLCYPGAIASLHHRIAHPLYELGAPINRQVLVNNSERGVYRTTDGGKSWKQVLSKKLLVEQTHAKTRDGGKWNLAWEHVGAIDISMVSIGR